MVLEINPDAMQIAQSLDEERKSGRLRGFVLGSFAGLVGLGLINQTSTWHPDPDQRRDRH